MVCLKKIPVDHVAALVCLSHAGFKRDGVCPEAGFSLLKAVLTTPHDLFTT